MACVAPKCDQSRTGERLFCAEHVDADALKRWKWLIDYAELRGWVSAPAAK